MYSIALCLTEINVSGTSKWGKSSVETLQYQTLNVLCDSF